MDYTLAQIASVVVPTFVMGLVVGWGARLVWAAVMFSPTESRQK